ncbi:hypothetical protein PV325_011092 [Microctonus aethiopoides]|nr:hypothetical protein PV325_011092 [Microctonus aethiopoides]KAK0091683.1 hypothetical protein PV326_002859 [Microctonus aethiopoides]
MLVSGSWCEAIVVTLAILVFVTGYRPPWWFWTGNSHQSHRDKIKDEFPTVRDIPGPFSLPILGTRWIFSWFGYYRMEKIHLAYKDMNQHYGPLCKEIALWNYPVVSVYSRHDIELVLRRSPRYPLRPPQEIISYYRRSRKDRYTNLGLVNDAFIVPKITRQGETWQKLRDALTPKLMDPKTVLGYFPALNKVSDDFISLIKSRRKGNNIHGFEELAYTMGLESTCTLILGRHLGFLTDTSTTLTTKLAEAVRIHFTASRDAFYGLPLWKIFPTTYYKQLIESEDTIYNIISELLETIICEQKDDAHDAPLEAVFQSILREKTLDIRDKKAAIIDFIAAGIHTLGNTLVFIFHLIGRNPEVQKNLYDEVAMLAPKNCDINADNLRSATYLRACINESFRFIPTTPCIARILDESITLSGYHLDPGTTVLLHTWIACLEDCNFRNASKWMPERWIRPMEPHSRLLVTPFGTGRRICPGKRFVEKGLQLIVARVVREFEIVAEDELELQFEYILAPKGPVSLSFHDRTDE